MKHVCTCAIEDYKTRAHFQSSPREDAVREHIILVAMMFTVSPTLLRHTPYIVFMPINAAARATPAAAAH